MKKWSDHYRETENVDDNSGGRGRNNVTFKSEDKAIVILFGVEMI